MTRNFIVSYVLIDAGNSCLKISTIENLSNSDMDFHVINYPNLYDDLFNFLFNTKPSNVLVSNVGNPVTFKIISEVVYKLWHIEPNLVNVMQNKYGLSTRYTDPKALGVDRWIAMIAARHEFKTKLCVIDCGTAVTIDVVSDAGMHLGGLITPGITMSRHSLDLKTNNLPLVENINENINNESALLAINTRDAILGGTLYQISAYIERIISEIKQEFGQDIECVITGGDAGKIQSLIYHHFHYRQTLILDGLRVMAQDIFNKDNT